MSIKIMSTIFEYDMPHLYTSDGKRVPDSTAKFVLLALADCANDEGEGAYPSIDTLCRKTSMSTATVCRAIEVLILHGYLYFAGFSKWGTKNYTILVAKILNGPQDFSGYNPGILVAKNKPSHKPPISKDIGESELSPENILPNIPGTTTWPKDVRQLAVTFAECKGRDPYGYEKGRWISAIREVLLPAQVGETELRKMYTIASDRIGPENIATPRSILFTLDVVRQKSVDIPDTTSNQAWRDQLFRRDE